MVDLQSESNSGARAAGFTLTQKVGAPGGAKVRAWRSWVVDSPVNQSCSWQMRLWQVLGTTGWRPPEQACGEQSIGPGSQAVSYEPASSAIPISANPDEDFRISQNQLITTSDGGTHIEVLVLVAVDRGTKPAFNDVASISVSFDKGFGWSTTRAGCTSALIDTTILPSRHRTCV
jgi:hypothetical protein